MTGYLCAVSMYARVCVCVCVCVCVRCSRVLCVMWRVSVECEACFYTIILIIIVNTIRNFAFYLFCLNQFQVYCIVTRLCINNNNNRVIIFGMMRRLHTQDCMHVQLVCPSNTFYENDSEL